jgi:hypothetical protein
MNLIMKKSLLFLVSFVFTNLIISQVPGLMWELVYEPQASMGREIIRTHDSCYLVTATNSAFDNGLTLKLDTAGNILWTSPYGGYSITQTIEGNYIIAGGLNYSAAFLRKIDANGNSLWLKTYGSTGQDDFHFVIQSADSGILSGGYSADYGKNAYLVKTDLEGNLIWERHFLSQGYACTSGAVEWEGNIYVVGRHEAYNNEYSLFAAKVDQMGNLLWHNLYDGGAYHYSVLIGDDENMFIAGGKHLTKINLLGEQVWTKYLSEANRIYSLQHTDDDNYIVSGGIHYGSFWYSAPLMAKFDTSGNLLWSKTWFGPELSNDNFESIVVSYNHGYVACGYSDYGSSDYRVRVLNTYPDPNVISGIDFMRTEKEFQICPNPTKRKFKLTGDIDKAEVYTISGEKIMENNHEDMNFDMTGYSQGIYLLKVITKGQPYSEKIILQ